MRREASSIPEAFSRVDGSGSPTELAQRVLMQLVAGGVAVEFLQPPRAPVRRRGAVFAAAMTMPETAVDE